MLEPTPGSIPPSYAALLRVPGFGRVALGTLLARLGGQMWEIVLVLFVLQRYQSAALAGLTVLLSILPGLILSPVAGALLDRQGRIRLMILDYAATAGVGALIVALSLSHRLPPPLLLLIVSVLGVSNILSITGARSLFPLMLPRALWDRANGLDTSMYSLTAVVGPAIAGLVVANYGPEAALLLTAALLSIARVNTDGRERRLSAGCSAIQGPTLVLLAFTSSWAMVFAIAVIAAAAGSVINVGIFALRQRRTDPAWFGRAFAVSMSLNFAGVPIGSALSGPLLEQSIALPLLLGAAVTMVGAVAAVVLIPKAASSG